MALFENFPYTNLHELNLDWLIQEMKELEQKVQDGPVVSVNGLTGEVVLYRESNIQFPDITDSTVTKWEMFRYLNGSIYGIQFDNNGNVYALRDFARTKLLTWDDIPPEAGVISVNGLYGVVHLSGTDIPYMGGETETVYDKLSYLDDDITSAQADINELSLTLTTVDNAIKRGIAYLESTNTAVNNIPSGRYVFWKNGAYISTSAISVGDPLSNTNLSAVATGGFINALLTQINTLNTELVDFMNNTDWVQSGDEFAVNADWCPFAGFYRSGDGAFYFQVPIMKKIGADKTLTISNVTGTLRRANGDAVISTAQISSATFSAIRTGNNNIVRLKVVPPSSLSITVPDYETCLFFGELKITFS